MSKNQRQVFNRIFVLASAPWAAWQQVSGTNLIKVQTGRNLGRVFGSRR